MPIKNNTYVGQPIPTLHSNNLKRLVEVQFFLNIQWLITAFKNGQSAAATMYIKSIASFAGVNETQALLLLNLFANNETYVPSRGEIAFLVLIHKGLGPTRAREATGLSRTQLEWALKQYLKKAKKESILLRRLTDEQTKFAESLSAFISFVQTRPIV